MTTEAPKISDDDLEKLKDHIRTLHGLKKPQDVRREAPSGRLSSVYTALEGCTTATPEIGSEDGSAAGGASVTRPRHNKTYYFRQQCIRQRLRAARISNAQHALQLQRMRRLYQRRNGGDSFKLNKAFHMRWKNIRGLPVVHSHFRKIFLETGKPPFVVPVHYKPFNVYWDADWAKQEFIFLDAAADDKKKKKAEEGQKATTTMTTTTAEPLPDMRDVVTAGGTASMTEQTLPPDERRSSGSSNSDGEARNVERTERQSTGYEGMPRDSLLEKAKPLF